MADAEGSTERVVAQDATEAPKDVSTEVAPEARLEELKVQATAKYAVKDYKAAAELYSRATELQAEVNGEMSPKNATLLYYYGRCLYHLAVSNSDVLGNRVAGEQKESTAKKAKQTAAESPKAAEDGDDATANPKAWTEEPQDPTAPKPFFQFQGDENFELSDEEGDEEGGEDGDEDGVAATAPAADDDFSDAFEVLDMARVLLNRQLDECSKDDNAPRTTIEELLADTHDLQAEISLENENFPAAAADMREALALKLRLFPVESSMVAEAHYKLSLALEFSAVTQQRDEQGNPVDGQPLVADEKMRSDAADEMQKAVDSCEARIAAEEAKAEKAEEADAKKIRKEVVDVKEMVEEMKLRLVDLRKPLVSVNDLVGEGAGAAKGVLGDLQGQTLATQKAIVDQVSKQANDLTGLVKRKRKDEDTEGAETASNGKRAKTEDHSDA